MKAKTKVTLCLKTSGEVIGEISNEYDEVVCGRHFGVMTEDEFRKCLKLLERVCLGVPINRKNGETAVFMSTKEWT